MTDTISHPPQVCRLFALPQELIDEIFDLAYPKEVGTAYVTPGQWDARQKILRREQTAASPYITKPFPAPKVCHFLVSKRFFTAAASAWVQNQTWDCTSGARAVLRIFTVLDVGDVIGAYITELTCTLHEVEWVLRFPNLKRLKIVVGAFDFRDIEQERLAWQEKLNDSDFSKVMNEIQWALTCRPERLGDLQEVACVAGLCN